MIEMELVLALYRKMCLLRSFDLAGTAAYGAKRDSRDVSRGEGAGGDPGRHLAPR